MSVWTLGTLLPAGAESLNVSDFTGFNVRVDSGDFATVVNFPEEEDGVALVSMSVWTLGTLLPGQRAGFPRSWKAGEFQCPCGLWGLCYLASSEVQQCLSQVGCFNVRVDSGDFATWIPTKENPRARVAFQCPCGLWGLCYRARIREQLSRPGRRFQCPCGLWGLCYPRSPSV